MLCCVIAKGGVYVRKHPIKYSSIYHARRMSPRLLSGVTMHERFRYCMSDRDMLCRLGRNPEHALPALFRSISLNLTEDAYCRGAYSNLRDPQMSTQHRIVLSGLGRRSRPNLPSHRVTTHKKAGLTMSTPNATQTSRSVLVLHTSI